MKQYDNLFKILLIGDPRVGKTSLRLRISDNTFQQPYSPTVSVDFCTATLFTPTDASKIQLWEKSTHQTSFNYETRSYCRFCDAILIVYSLDSKQSYSNIRSHYEAVKINEDIVVYLVGNKWDLERQGEIDDGEIERLNKELGVRSYKVSAKSGEGVQHLVSDICLSLLFDRDRKGKGRDKLGLGQPQQGGSQSENRRKCW